MNKRPVDYIFPRSHQLKLEGKCPFCKESINEKDFQDELSRREFHISGMCQSCQNEIFKED